MKRDPASIGDDRAFLESFEAAEFSAGKWNHAAHLRITFLYLRNSHFQDAIRRLRNGLRRLHRSHGRGEGDPAGYHETRTLVWARLVSERVGPEWASSTWAAFIGIHGDLLDESRIGFHYSNNRLDTVRARCEFVLPDRAPLPVREDVLCRPRLVSAAA